MSTTPSESSLFDEVATLFASAPSQNTILEFLASHAIIERANQLLELNRANALVEASRRELDRSEQVELLMRLVKVRIRTSQNKDSTHTQAESKLLAVAKLALKKNNRLSS